MSEGIVLEIIGGFFAVTAVIITGYFNRQKQNADLDKKFQEQTLKIAGQFEKHLAVIEEKIKSITDKLKDFDDITKMVHEHDKYIAVRQALDKRENEQ